MWATGFPCGRSWGTELHPRAAKTDLVTLQSVLGKYHTIKKLFPGSKTWFLPPLLDDKDQ